MTRTAKFEDVYPPLKGYSILTRTGGKNAKKYLHVGYTTTKARKCQCGEYPVFEQYTLDRSPKSGKHVMRNVPAQVFVAICPICERRAAGEGSVEDMLGRWNEGQMSADSEIVSEKPKKFDDSALAALASVLVAKSIDETIELIHERHKIKKMLNNPLLSDLKMKQYCIRHIEVVNKLEQMQFFFETSPFTEGYDPEAILSDIRKQIYPGKTMKDIEARAKIPLELARM